MSTSKVSKHRKSAFQHQKGHCCYCGFLMWQDSAEAFAAEHKISVAQAQQFQCTAEHLKARSDGGKNAANNIAAACKRCNQLRHKRNKTPSPENYQQLVQKRLTKGKWHNLPPSSNLKRKTPCSLSA